MPHSHQLLGISNAIVDILAHVDPDFIASLGAPAGSMTLIDADEARALYAKLGPTTEMSGGSVGNSVALFAQLGGSAAYIGRVADDQFGDVFTHDMRSIGVDTRLPPETRHAPTARSHVLITPDGQRTMQTYLGACTELEPDDIDGETIGSPAVVLIEGYLFDTPHGPAAIDKLISELPKTSRVALSLSDSFCVERHLQTFQQLIGSSITIAIGNETEFNALFGTQTHDATLAAAASVGALCVITRSADGASVVDGDQTISSPAEVVANVVDTTGAGDAFAGGFLYEWTRSHDARTALSLAMRCGAAAIQQIGARLPNDKLPKD
ncbi:MAG: adenosine kinase [Pseudomonadota bacterium]